MKYLKDYMAQNNLENDNEYKVLCDDLFIICATIGTKNAKMYQQSRLDAQGSQSAVRPSKIAKGDSDIVRMNAIDIFSKHILVTKQLSSEDTTPTQRELFRQTSAETNALAEDEDI